MADIIKNDGTTQSFEINKLLSSIEKPLREAGIDDPAFVLKKAMFIQDMVYARGQNIPSSEVGDMALKALMDFGNVNAVKNFVLKKFL